MPPPAADGTGVNDVPCCAIHPFERTDRMCGRCGYSYCDDCLIVPSPRKPPLCKACAMAAAGIRSTAAITPVRTAREIRALEKARRRAEAQQAATDASAAGAWPPPGPPGPPTPARTRRWGGR